MSKKKVELKRYEFQARVTRTGWVVVEAENIEAARAAAESGRWVEDYANNTEDWDIISGGREDV